MFLSNLVLVSSKATSSGCLCVCDYTQAMITKLPKSNGAFGKTSIHRTARVGDTLYTASTITAWVPTFTRWVSNGRKGRMPSIIYLPTLAMPNCRSYAWFRHGPQAHTTLPSADVRVIASINPLFSQGPKSSSSSSPPPTQQLALHLCRLLQPNSDAGLFLPTTLTLPGVDSRDWVPPPLVLYTHPLPH
jgi:hypothetical protein